MLASSPLVILIQELIALLAAIIHKCIWFSLQPKVVKFASVFVNEVTYDDNNNPVDICDISDEMIRNEMADVAYCLSLSIALERDEWVEVFDEIEIPQT